MLIGQLLFAPKGKGRAAIGRLYGLNVLRAETDPDGFWRERRLRRAGRTLRQGGAARVLVPRDFDRWALLEDFGLRPVDPTDFIRSQSVPLALELLERRGLTPERASVALRGERADRDMLQTAARLCPQVRSLVIDAPRGGGELAAWLRREFGVPILPPGERGHLALAFHPGCPLEEETRLELYGSRPELAGLSLTAPELAEEDRTDLPLLAALWEGGKLGEIKIT